MTAMTFPTTAAASATGFGRLAGFRSLFFKDVREWMRGHRIWFVLATTTTFMVLSAANSWIQARIAATLPPDVPQPVVGPQDAFHNLAAAVGSQIFVVVAIFAVASLLVRERESGTLAWVASKPVTRGSIWLSKWTSASAMLAVSAAIVPLVATAAMVAVLYGMPPVGAVVGAAAGMIAVIVFFVSVGLAAGTVVPSQPAIAAVGFAVFALLPLLAGIIPFDVAPFLPTSILSWAVGLGTGQPVGVVTPLAWAAATGGLVVLSVRQMRRLEL